MYITDENIDDLIKQYHVNYYENIFGEDDTPGAKFKELFDKTDHYYYSVGFFLRNPNLKCITKEIHTLCRNIDK